jgi:hypothetical protein
MENEQLIKASRKKWLRQEKAIHAIIFLIMFVPPILVAIILWKLHAPDIFNFLVIATLAAIGFYGEKYKIEEKIEKLFYK